MADAMLALFACLLVGSGALWLLWCVNHLVVPAIDSWDGRRRDGISAAAERRARALFLSKLDARQRRDWVLRRRFRVRGSAGTPFVVSAYRPYNVRTDDAVFCLQVVGVAPAFDKLLAQKLLLEADEAYFLALANVRTYSNRWRPRVEAARADCRERGLIAPRAPAAVTRAAS